MSSEAKIRIGVSGIIVRDAQILLVAFNDQSGFHYNFPGGGVQEGESLHMALHRELYEEAAVKVIIGRLLLVWEFRAADYPAEVWLTNPHRLNVCFECQLIEGCQPCLPDQPDPHQVGVDWITLQDFPTCPLIPPVQRQLVQALAGELANPFIPRVMDN